MNDHGIVRLPEVDYDLEIRDAQSEVLRRAHDELGYVPGVPKPADVDGDRRSLSRMLVDAGVQRLDAAAVEKYQRRVARAANHIAVKAAAAVAVSVLFGAFATDGSHGWLCLAEFLIFGFIGLFLGAMLAFLFPDTAWCWRRRPLSLKDGFDHYRQPIPSAVLSVALSLKAANGCVKFYVEGLEREDRFADPFLIAKVGSAEAYVAVWDEPKFE